MRSPQISFEQVDKKSRSGNRGDDLTLNTAPAFFPGHPLIDLCCRGFFSPRRRGTQTGNPAVGKKALTSLARAERRQVGVFIFIRHASQTKMIYLRGCTRLPETFGKYKISRIRLLTGDSKNPLAGQTRR